MYKTVDVSKFKDLKDYQVTNIFQPRWDNTLLITPYDQYHTYVLTTDGEELILPQRLKAILHDFSEYAETSRLEMDTLYSIVKERTKGVIAGHYELVPTCGQTNCRVAYYMAHAVDHYSKNEQGIVITFKGDNGSLISALVDACPKTFERLREKADQVGRIQLELVKNLCNRFGIGDTELTHFVGATTPHERELHRKQNEQVFFDQIVKIVQQAAEKMFGEDLDKGFYEYIRKSLGLY